MITCILGLETSWFKHIPCSAPYSAASGRTPRWLLKRQFGDLCAVLVLWAHNRDSAVQIFSHHKKQFSTYTLFRTILCYQKLLSGRLRKDYSEMCWLCWYHTLLLENLSGRLDYLEICWLCWYDEPLTVTQWYTLIDASHHTLTVFSNTHVFCCVCFLVCEVTHHFTHKKTNTLNIYPDAHHILLPLAEKLGNFRKDLFTALWAVLVLWDNKTQWYKWFQTAVFKTSFSTN